MIQLPPAVSWLNRYGVEYVFFQAILLCASGTGNEGTADGIDARLARLAVPGQTVLATTCVIYGSKGTECPLFIKPYTGKSFRHTVVKKQQMMLMWGWQGQLEWAKPYSLLSV